MRSLGNEREIGITDVVHNAAEGPVILLFGLITQLGDVWLLFLLSGSLYIAGTALPQWGIDRRRALFVLALALTYVTLIGALKALFQSPRPPGATIPPELSWIPSILAPLVESTTTAESPGFPSGHALGSTMVWGSLALVLDRGSFQNRIGFAGGMILLISFSRLVLGVHYVVDVVVGIGLGVLVLGTLYWLTEHGSEPGWALLAAVGAGMVGLGVDITFDSVAASGGAVGGWLVWRVVAENMPANPTTKREVVIGALIFGAAAILFGALIAVEPPLLLAFAGSAVSAGLVVGAPLLSQRFA